MGSDASGTGEPIRVLIGDLPNLVRKVVQQALVGAGYDVSLLEQGPTAAPDVVIIPGVHAAVPPLCHDLLQRGARIKFITLVTRPDRVDLYEARLIGSDVGLEGVVSAVRAVAHA